MAKTEALGKGSMGEPLRTTGADGDYKFKNYLFVIAINDYEYIADLKNCVRDAEEVIKLLTEDFEFEQEEVTFICGDKVRPEFTPMVVKETVEGKLQAAKATRHVILDELYDLARKIKEDQEEDPELKVNLVLYYSGHGHLNKLINQGYWIPADAREKDYGKHISNSTISDFLSGIKTHHTLVLSDSCFAGSIFASGQGKSIDATRLESVPSRWGITAGRNEIVSDGKGDHSPFADSFLTTLRSQDVIAADALGIFIRQRVASSENQTPLNDSLRIPGHENGIFVFRKKANARKHFEAGLMIIRLARHKPEYARFRSAASQFELARRLSKKREERAEYLLWEVRALSYAGLYKNALDTLIRFQKRLTKKYITEDLKSLQLGLELLEDTDSVIARFKKGKLTHLPEWMKKVLSLYLNKTSKSKDYHLVGIGINKYSDNYFSELRGCINDVEKVTTTLTGRLGSEKFNLTTLYDQDATYKNITQALVSLQESVKKEDWVFVHFSSHAFSINVNKDTQKEEDAFIITHDSVFDRQTETCTSITGQKLHEYLQAIPSRNVVLFLDLDYNQKFTELAQQGKYALLQGTSAGENAKEKRLAEKSYGIFTYALTESLDALSLTSEKALLTSVKELIKRDKLDQCPLFVKAENFVNHWRLSSLDTKDQLIELLKLLYGPQRKWNPKEVTSFLQVLATLHLDFTAAEWLRLGDQLPEEGESKEKYAYYEKSISAFGQTAASLTRQDEIYLHLKLANFHVKEGSIQPARHHFLTAQEKMRPDTDEHKIAAIDENLKKLESLETDKYALVIGIDRYKNQELAPGAIADAERWVELLKKMGYKEDHITLLKNEEASTSAIREQLKLLGVKAESRPAFFFFAGIGTGQKSPDYQAIFAYDNEMHTPPELRFSALESLCHQARHLTVVVDAGFEAGSARYYPPVKPGDEEKPAAEHTYKGYFGNACILPGAWVEESQNIVPLCLETGAEPEGGVLSSLLINRLTDHLLKNKHPSLKDINHPDLPGRISIKGKWLEY
jgi:hypothetical protein